MTWALRRLVWLAPLVFALHVVEEAPGFVAWFNGVVARDITQPRFLGVNAAALAVTVRLAALVASSPEPSSGLALAAGVGFSFWRTGCFTWSPRWRSVVTARVWSPERSSICRTACFC